MDCPLFHLLWTAVLRVHWYLQDVETFFVNAKTSPIIFTLLLHREHENMTITGSTRRQDVEQPSGCWGAYRRPRLSRYF